MKISKPLAIMIAQSAISEPYRQTPYFTTNELSEWLKKRKVELGWRAIHHLWTIGILHPVAVLKPAYLSVDNPEDRFESIELGLPEECFVDLGTSVEDDAPLSSSTSTYADGLRESLLWHPFQLWMFVRLVRSSKGIGLSGDFWLGDPERIADVIQTLIIPTAQDHTRHLGNDKQYHDFLHVLAILLAAEPLVHSMIDTVMRFSPLSGESFEGYFQWSGAQEGAKILTDADISIDDVISWHERLAICAQFMDPISHWRILLRHADRSSRARMQQEVLAAYDLYDHAEILRRYVERYHGRELIEEDGITHGPGDAEFKHRVYGVRRTGDLNRMAFRRIARQFGVDPQARTILFLEGDTEVGFIRRLAEHLHIDLEAAGIEILNLSGIGGLKDQRLRELLRFFQRTETFVFIAIDKDDQRTHVRELENFIESRLVLKESTVFEPDFEQANFSLSELAEIATLYAQDAGVDITISGHDLTRQMNDREKPQPAGKAIENLWWKLGHFSDRKGSDWGRALADWAISHDCPGEIEAIDGQRPMSWILMFLRRGQRSHYQTTFAK